MPHENHTSLFGVPTPEIEAFMVSKQYPPAAVS